MGPPALRLILDPLSVIFLDNRLSILLTLFQSYSFALGQFAKICLTKKLIGRNFFGPQKQFFEKYPLVLTANP